MTARTLRHRASAAAANLTAAGELVAAVLPTLPGSGPSSAADVTTEWLTRTPGEHDAGCCGATDFAPGRHDGHNRPSAPGRRMERLGTRSGSARPSVPEEHPAVCEEPHDGGGVGDGCQRGTLLQRGRRRTRRRRPALLVCACRGRSAIPDRARGHRCRRRSAVRTGRHVRHRSCAGTDRRICDVACPVLGESAVGRGSVLGPNMEHPAGIRRLEDVLLSRPPRGTSPGTSRGDARRARCRGGS